VPRPRPLFPYEAKRALAQRLSPLANRIRQFATKFGIRSRRVFLVWTEYTGSERGEGTETEIARLEILPTPRVSELTAIQFQAFSAGTLPTGSVRVDLISALLAQETLMGELPPATKKIGGRIRESYDFFYEVVEDNRVSPEPERAKFRLLSNPTRQEGNVCWVIMLERESEDRRPNGQSNYGTDKDD